MIPHRHKLATKSVLIILLYRLTILISLVPKNTILIVKNTKKIKNQIMLYLTDKIRVQIPVWLIPTDTKKVTAMVPKNTRTKFLRGKWAKKVWIFFCFQKYRPKNPHNHKMIISFRIQTIFQKVPSNQSLNVTKVCKKNCNKSQTKNILATRVKEEIIFWEFMRADTNQKIKRVSWSTYYWSDKKTK